MKKTFSSVKDITTWVDDNNHVWTKDSETGEAIDLTQKKMDEEKAKETNTPIIIRPRPEEIVDIEEEEVAKADSPIQKKQSVKETKEIGDMEVALSENPLAGDETPWGWMILAVTSLAGLVGLKFFRK